MRILIFILLLMSSAFAQTPPIESGVSHELAKWRSARYSDVRYKLNLTLEKMSPVLKGTIEIRVNVRDEATAKGSPPYEGGVAAALGGRGGSFIVLDWRKIKGYEERSNVSNVFLNGKRVENHPGVEASLLRKEGSSERPLTFAEQSEHLIFRDGVVTGENVIKLDFTSPILTSGSAVTRYVDKEDGAEYIYSLFVPSDASTAFPVFDQPDLKARFELTVRAPEEWQVVSNGLAGERWGELQNIVDIARAEEDEICGGRLGCPSGFKRREFNATDYFAQTRPISTYVFAFAAGPWQQVSQSGADRLQQQSEPRAVATGSPDLGWRNSDLGLERNATTNPQSQIPNPQSGRPVATAQGSDLSTHVFVRKSQLAKFQPHAAEVFRLNREGIKFLETYFDYKFPFPKYDIVLIPEFPFGGMEHAGATFLRESSVIFPQEPTKNDYISRANVIFHEAAHQWFGDTVTMKWFDDLWLKEGFAEFMAYKTLEKVMPEYNAWKVFYERNKQAAYLTDSTKGTTPIYQEIKNLSAAKSAYGNIVYRKAPSFLKQAEFYIGPDKFQGAVRAFLKKHEFGNAGWEDLVREFEAASGQDLKEWATAWVTTRGLPRTTMFSFSPWASGETLIPVNQRGLGDHVLRPMSFNFYIVTKNNKPEIMRVAFAGKANYGDKREEERLIVKRESIPALPKDLLLAFPNYQDYGYGIFLLDDKSRDYVLKNIQNEKDDFLRSMMWGSLWDSVREGELDPKEYVELVVKILNSDVQSPSVQSPAFRRPTSVVPNAAGNEGRPPKGGTQNEAKRPPKGGTQNASNGESDESTIATLLGRVATAMTYYRSEPRAVATGSPVGVDSTQGNPVATAQGSDLSARLESMLIEKMRTAPTLGQRITYYRAFLNVASTDTGRSTLKDILNLKFQISDLKLKTKDRFDIVTRLLILNDPDAPKLLADLEQSETSDEAKRYAYAAKAGIPTAENKAKFWNDFTTNKDISESWIEAAFGPFNSVRHADLTLPYLERALKELPNHKRNRKIFFINGWLGAFIGGQKSEEALAIVNKFLNDNPDLDRDLRLKILENVDLIERAVKIRKRFPSGR